MHHKPSHEDLEKRVRELESAESERIRAEAALEETCRMGHIGGWEFDAITGEGSWTSEAARIHDLDPAVPITKDLGLQYYTESSREKITAAVKDAVEQGIPYDLEVELLSAKGVRKWVQTIGRPVTANGKVVRVVGILRDITDHRRRENYNRMLIELLDAVPGCVLIHDLEGRILYVNRTAHEIHGYEKADFMKLTLQEVTDPESRLLMPERLKTLAEKGKASFALNHLRKDGKPLPLQVDARLADWDGHPAVLSVSMDITDLKLAEAAIRESEERFRTLIEGAPEGIFIQREGRFQYLNPAMGALLGTSEASDLVGAPILDRVAPEYHEAIQSRIHHQDETGAFSPLQEQEFLRMDGSKISVEATGVACNFDGKAGRVVFVRNITLRKKAEAEREELQVQLQQIQKLESIGQLAGGVAHDYNNMLNVILGFADLAIEKEKSGEPVHGNLLKIKAAAERSADITRQLLAFARKQTIAPKILDLNRMVDGMLAMLHRLIGEDIDLVWLPQTNPALVTMDPSQVDQIIANLCINARDAIGGVGAITLETRQVTFDDIYCAAHAECLPGDFVMLAVSDDGCGMDRETAKKIFEPFFTTKALGRGTGLGLATVYGIVKQNSGFINVYSEPGKGSTFKVYLPEHRGAAADELSSVRGGIPMGAGEVVLAVEDDPDTLDLIQSILLSIGYTPLTTDRASDALRIAEASCNKIALLITDVVMPGMNGRELAERVQCCCPGLKTLFVSGYTANVIAHRGILDRGVNFLQKPFSREDLAVKLREILPAGAECPPGS